MHRNVTFIAFEDAERCVCHTDLLNIFAWVVCKMRASTSILHLTCKYY